MAERTNPHADIIVGAQDQATPVFDKIKGSAAGMAQGVEQSATKAGNSLRGMGDEAKKAAIETERANTQIKAAVTRALSAQQRAMVEAKGFSLQSAEGLEELARLRKADVSAVEGQLGALRKLRSETDALASAQRAAAEVQTRQSNFIASLTRETDAIGKTRAQLVEMQAAQLGLSAQAAPFIAKLRAQEQQFGAYGLSAKQTAAALRGVPAQITDIMVSLQGGQAPLTVLLQQGGQLKDMFGGIVPAVRALGSVLISQLANPLVLAAGAVGGLAFAYNQGSKEEDAYRLSLVKTGNAVGTTVGQMNQMAVSIDGVIGTQGKAAETLAIFATQAVAGSRSLEGYSKAAIAWERASGQAVGETAKQFASLKETPLQSVMKLNEGMNFLTESVYQQIKSLEEQGKTAEAAKVAQDALANALNERSAEMVKNLGGIERGWIAIKDVVAETWDAIKSIGRDVGPEGQLAAQQAVVDNYEAQISSRRERGLATGDLDRQAASARQRLADLQHEVALNALNASIEGDRAVQVKARADADKDALKYLSDEVKMRRQIAAETEKIRLAYTGKTGESDQAAMAKEIAEREAAIRKTYEKSGAKSISERADAYTSLLKPLSQQIALLEQEAAQGHAVTEAQKLRLKVEYDIAAAKGKLTEVQKESLRATAEEVIALQQSAALRDGELKLAQMLSQQRQDELRGIEAYMQAQEDAARKALESVQERITSLQGEEQAMSIAAAMNISLAEAVERVAIARLEEKQAGFYEGSEGWLAIQREIDARRELLGLIGSKEAREANKRAADDAAKDWERTAQTISDTLADYIMSGGKDAAQYLKRLFATLVLQPTVQTLVGGILGTGPAAAASGSSNILGTASNLGSLGAFGGTVSAGLSYGATSLFANGLGTTLAAGGQMIGAGSIVSGISTIAGALGPIALGVAALTSLIGSLDDSGTPHAGAGAVYSGGKVTGGRDVYSYDRFDLADMNTYSDQVQGLVSPVAQSIGAALDAFATAFGQQAGYTVSTAFADDSSKDASWGALRIEDALGQVLVDWNSDRQSKWAPREFADGEQGQKEYLAAIARDTRDALKTALGDADWAKDMLDTLGDSVTLEGLGSVVAQINQAKAAFTSFGQYMPTFAGLAQSAVSAMVDAAGGVDPLAQGMSAFVENFYSESEKLAINTENVRKALQELGFEMPETRDEFKALVQAQLALGDAGAKTAAGLLGLSGAFAAVTPAAESAQSSIASVSDQLRDAFGMTADAVSGILSDAVKNAETASEAQRMAAQAFEDKFYGGALDGLTDSLGAMIQSSVIAPMMESLIAGSAASASLLASGGAVAAGAMASGGAAGGAASAAGGSSAAGAMASGGASAANAMVSGGSAAGAIVASAVEQARAQVNAYTQILSDPDVQAGIKDISKLMGEVAGMTFTASSSWGGGGGYSVGGGGGGGGAGSEADKLAESLKKLGETVEDEIKRLAGLMNDADPQKERAALLAEFAVQTAKAKTGDQAALGELTGLSKAIEQATKLTAASAFDLSATRGWLASSLEGTLKALNLEVPKFDVGTNYVPRTTLAMVHEGEAIVPKAYNPWAGGAGGGQDQTALASEIRALREENRQQAGEIARLNLRMARVLERWDGGGMPAERLETA